MLLRGKRTLYLVANTLFMSPGYELLSLLVAFRQLKLKLTLVSSGPLTARGL